VISAVAAVGLILVILPVSTRWASRAPQSTAAASSEIFDGGTDKAILSVRKRVEEADDNPTRGDVAGVEVEAEPEEEECLLRVELLGLLCIDTLANDARGTDTDFDPDADDDREGRGTGREDPAPDAEEEPEMVARFTESRGIGLGGVGDTSLDRSRRPRVWERERVRNMGELLLGLDTAVVMKGADAGAGATGWLGLRSTGRDAQEVGMMLLPKPALGLGLVLGRFARPWRAWDGGGLTAKEGEGTAGGTRGKGRGTWGVGLAGVPALMVAVGMDDIANDEEEASF